MPSKDKKKGYEYCRQPDKQDCFAYADRGKCLACGDTPEAGNCPFYKTREQRRNGHCDSLHRLTGLGRYDLIYKYGYDGFQARLWGEI